MSPCALQHAFFFIFHDSWLSCHEFEPSTAEDPPQSGERRTLNLSRAPIVFPLVWVQIVRRGQYPGGRPSHLTIVQITRSVTKDLGVVEQCDVNIHFFMTNVHQ
ncbi:hypothetical protein TNCV_1708471 [Trichonephila clavipes]|nr:hypothetical protein TNCV_1708471 [Trichonephila clavipes]